MIVDLYDMALVDDDDRIGARDKESRWVMMTIVRPRAIAARCCWMMASLSGSSELVASSSTSTGGSWISARAIARRWRWPPERFAALSSSIVE